MFLLKNASRNLPGNESFYSELMNYLRTVANPKLLLYVIENEFLTAGQFYGQNSQTLRLDGKTLTDTEYDYKFVDWHFHENPYFSLGISGSCCEINKRESLECLPDTLAFHNCYEPHCNTKADGVSRQFQIEVSQDWCQRFEIRLDHLPNAVRILDPNDKLHFYNIYKETKFSTTHRISRLIHCFCRLLTRCAESRKIRFRQTALGREN